MTETDQKRIEALEAKIEELTALLTQKPSSDNALERIAQYLDQQASKPRKEKWRNRKLVEFPNKKKHYVTDEELKAKELVDAMINSKKLSINASEAALNKFLKQQKIRDLPRSLSYWAKQYYKQYYLKYPKREVRKINE